MSEDTALTSEPRPSFAQRLGKWARARISSFAQRLGKWARIEPGEGPGVVTAFVLFFCVFTGYFAVRPVRETIGTILGAHRVSNLFVITWIVSVAIVPLYGVLCARFRRQVFLPWIYGFVALALGICGLVFLQAEGNVPVGAFFYVLISVLSLFIVSVFWSFLVEMFDGQQAKRLFGTIAAGGTAGALAGPVMTSLLVGRIGNAGVLFFGAAMFVVAILCQRILLRIWVRGGSSSGAPAKDRPIGGNPFAGFWLVLKSPYLLGIALFVMLLGAVTTFLYFEQLALVRQTFHSTAQRTRVFGEIDATVQSLTILCQIFLTGRLASKWGVGLLLTAVPLAMVGGLLLLAAFHTFAVLAVVMIARRVGEYAFVRPGREMLFSPLSTETKYKAKNLIDVPVYRGGDALVAQVINGKAMARFATAGFSPAILGAAFAAAWAAVGWWLGRRREHAQPPVAPGAVQPAQSPAR